MPKSVSPRTGQPHRNVFDINHFPLDRANRYVIRWDMRIRRSVSRAFAAMVFPAICAGAVLYFGYYAIWGARGVLALADTNARLAVRQEQLASLRDQRHRLEKRIRLMAHGDSDIVEEQARDQLMDGGTGEVAVPRKAH